MNPLFLLVLFAASTLSAFVEFPLENISAQPPIADDAGLDQSPIALDSPHIVSSSDGHFTLGKNGKRVRFWGVNLCYNANFPSHEQATLMAQRMRMVGINIVRFHHADSDDGAYPYSFWDETYGTKFSDEAIDRLHFLISELAKNGIYTNMNLHVNKKWSRYLNLPDYDYFDKRDKIVNFVSHEVTEMHRWFAKKLLTMKNKYRGNLTLVEDPAIAIVEISNENSLFMRNVDEILASLPDYYNNEFHTNFSLWLKTKYSTTENLRKAWAPLNPVECEASLTSRVCDKKVGADDLITKKLSSWRLGKKNDAAATLTENEDGSVTISVTKTSETDWHLQLSHGNMVLDTDKTYIFEFYAKSIGAERPLGFTITMNESPYSQLASGGDVTLTTEWKKYRYVRKPTQSFENSRIVFAFATSDVSFMLANVSFIESDCDYTQDNLRSWDDWLFNVISPAEATKTYNSEDGSYTIDITKAGPKNWYVQDTISGLNVVKDTTYVIFLYGKSTVNVSTSAAMCIDDLCTYQNSFVNTTAGLVSFTYTAPMDGQFKLKFSIGDNVVKITIYNISMAAGGCTGLGDSETIDNLRVLSRNDIDTSQKKIDRDVFLAVLENRYFEGMYKYIKETLGYPGLVTGTINYGTLAIYGQHAMDFIDSHAYWSHPTFPTVQWSSTDWLVSQDVMSLNPESATFWKLLKTNGKPYTITEYNHAAPADGQAETIPMIAAWASLQDIDGIFIFAYAHNYHYKKYYYKMNGYFDIDYNPSKWTMMKNAALIYPKGLVPPLAETKVLDISQYSQDIEKDVLPALTKYRDVSLSKLLSYVWPDSTYSDWIRTRINYNYGFWPKVTPEVPASSKNDPPVISWDKAAGFSVSTSRAIVFTGNATNATGRSYEWGSLDLSEPELVSLSVTPYDGMRLNRSEKIVVVLASRVENTGMKWTDGTRTSVSDQWGTSPALCEVSTGSLKLRGIALPGTSCVWTPMNAEGLKISEAAATVTADSDGVIVLTTSPSTIWYSLDCNRTGYPVDPVDELSSSSSGDRHSSTPFPSSSTSTSSKMKDGSSSLYVSWVVMMVLVFFLVLIN